MYLPPLGPLVCVVCCDADVTDGCFEPNVEYLVLVALEGDPGAPLEVPGDAPGLEAALDPRVGDHTSVVGPRLGTLIQPASQSSFQFGKVHKLQKQGLVFDPFHF